MPSRTKIGLDAIDRIKHAFDALPPYHDDEVTKTQAIRMLIPHIEAIRAKGYGLPAIVSLLSEHGVAITVSSLKTVLSPSRREAEGKRKRKARRKPQTTPTAAEDARSEVRRAEQAKPAQTRPHAVAPSVDKAEAHLSTTQSRLVDARREPRVGSAVTPAERRSMFTPREDSDEI